MRSARPLLFLTIVVLALGLSGSDPLAQRTGLAERVGHHDPSRYRAGRSHGSVGDMNCMTLLPGAALQTNLYFLHRCQITPGGGVGHHFHNTTEEMFVIFDGEAEFTVDGRTSLLKGTVGAPVRMGHSHAIYNPGKTPVEFMNINVSAVKGKYDAFDLDDARVGAPKDEKPVFMTMRLDKKLLRPADKFHGGSARRCIAGRSTRACFSRTGRMSITSCCLRAHPRACIGIRAWRRSTTSSTATARPRSGARPLPFTKATRCRCSSAIRMRSGIPAIPIWNS